MAEESAKPPTITTPVGHMCTCEHPARVSAGLRLRSTEGCCENAARALKMLASAALGMNAAGWQNAAWHVFIVIRSVGIVCERECMVILLVLSFWFHCVHGLSVILHGVY